MRVRLLLTAAALLPAVALVSNSSAQTPPPAYSGYATGTVVHVDAGQSGTTQLTNAELGFAGATVASTGTGGVTQGAALSKAGLVVNEMGQVVQPQLPVAADPKLHGDRSYGRGSGLEVGIGTTIPSASPSVSDFNSKVQVSAPANNTADSSLLSVPAAPLATATAVRGQAAARWASDACVLGAPISQGIGYIADATLLDTAGNTAPLVATESGQGVVSQTTSLTQLDRALDATGKPIASATGLGLDSQSTQVIAPVTLFSGTPAQVTIEVAPLGLRAVAGGVPGSAHIFYAPDLSAGPTTPIVRITQGTGPTATTQSITAQDFFGSGGLTVPAGPLATVTVGTPPHLIGDPSKPAAVAADGTSAAAAVDAVSVQLLTPDPTTHLTDLRIGHMEARAVVPAGGIHCGIPVTKTATPTVVAAGHPFLFTITVTNPYDCKLTNVAVVDVVSATRGVKYVIQSTSPASTHTASRINFTGVPDIAPHSSTQLRISMFVPASSAAGLITDTVNVSANCGSSGATSSAGVTIPLTGKFVLHAPRVTAAKPNLPRTG